jgi:hypothetical protein
METLFDLPDDHPTPPLKNIRKDKKPERTESTPHSEAPLPTGERILAPTDVSQYIGLDRCERFLRFRLHEKAFDRQFLKDLDVVGQEIPPLMGRMGRDFEKSVWKELCELSVKRGSEVWDCVGAASQEIRSRHPDNEELIARLRELSPGKRLLIYQPRLEAKRGAWTLRGDADILIAAKSPENKISLGIADIKSSVRPKVDQRLQVAFYRAMLMEILTDAGFEDFELPMGILYRGPIDFTGLSEEEKTKFHQDRETARQCFGLRKQGFFEFVQDAAHYDAEVKELVTDPDSACEKIATQNFNDLFFSLGTKCDSCLYQQYCFKNAHQTKDLSLIPHLTPRDKKALLTAGVKTVPQLATLKDYSQETGLTSRADTQETVRRLAASGIGARLDELILRARRTHIVNFPTPLNLPTRGHTSLPHTSDTHNPNLVTIYLDAQTDYINGRVYLVGAKVVAHEYGQARREHRIVHITDGPPESIAQEAALLRDLIRDIWQSLATLAFPDAAGQRRAPIHLIFWNGHGESALMNALIRHLDDLREAAPLYEFLAQRAAFDSPVITYLDQEVRERRNYQFLCQSLQAVSRFHKFEWGNGPDGVPLRRTFRERLFDDWEKLPTQDDEGNLTEEWIALRSRFRSQIPLEYAYAAWEQLEPPQKGKTDPLKAYRNVTVEHLRAFQKRRMEAMQHIAVSFEGNRDTEKTSFDLPELAAFAQPTAHYAEALREFLLVERHEALSEWKSARNLPAERRALLGETVLVRYLEPDQSPEVRERNQENLVRHALHQQYEAEFRAENPHAKKVSLSKEQKAETACSYEDLTFRLRVTQEGTDADLDTLVSMANFEAGKRFILNPRWIFDTRLPVTQRKPLNPTPKSMLWNSMLVELKKLDIQRDAQGHSTEAFAEIAIVSAGGLNDGFTYRPRLFPFQIEELYTLDHDPNDWHTYQQYKLCEELCQQEEAGTPETHTLYSHLARKEAVWETNWPEDAVQGQRRFYDGLQAFDAQGMFHSFEASKEEYIAHHGGDSVLLVQGPPGTGKSYTSAFALLARVQGALAANIPLRVFLSCKTHSATDVLIQAVADAKTELETLRKKDPGLWAQHFNPGLLTLPLYRYNGKDSSPPGIFEIAEKQESRMVAEDYFVVAATPGGIRKVAVAVAGKEMLGSNLCDLLMIDEASQISVPEALMASLPLTENGRIIVVGDPRQMPPIVRHEWAEEKRLTLKQFGAHRSLFETLEALNPPKISFEESFRLHQTMAKFLCDEIYIRDGINYHSNKINTLPDLTHEDEYVAAVLDSAHPLIVIIHGEESSQKQNPFEQMLIAPILHTLADAQTYGLKADKGFGVVVPHRAQRIALRQAFPELSLLDSEGNIVADAVDTVERYQGGERDVILVSATESDPEYLRASAGFLLDPRRLNVALSRAKKKMILIASRSVFSFFSSDEELYENSLIWKNLLRRSCTVLLWEGIVENIPVRVWGAPSQKSNVKSH